MDTYRTFTSEQEAKQYRFEHGTGGWIFVPTEPGECILFPAWITPHGIFHHPFTKGKSGRLLGAM